MVQRVPHDSYEEAGAQVGLTGEALDAFVETMNEAERRRQVAAFRFDRLGENAVRIRAKFYDEPPAEAEIKRLGFQMCCVPDVVGKGEDA